MAVPKPIIAVDVDDVLLVHYQDLINWYNATYGTRLTLAQNGNLDPTPWGTDDATEAIRRVHGFFETDIFKNQQPMPGAFEALTELSKRYVLVALTARDSLIENFTRQWLKRHFPSLFQEVYFTEHYSLKARSQSKTDVCLELGVSYYIDDSLSSIIKLNRAGVGCVLFGDYPWNRAAELPEGVVRCKDWTAVLEYFDGRDD